MKEKNKINLILLVLVLLALVLFAASNSRAGDFLPDFIADGWSYEPFAIVPYWTNAIAFDSANNLYVTNAYEELYINDTITVRKYAAPDYDLENPSVYVSYSKTFDVTSGIDFDEKGNLFVSEIIRSNNPTGYTYPDAGLIRMVRANTLKVSDPITFIEIPVIGNFRATGLAAVGKETIYFPGRKWSDPNWGKLYKIESFKKYVAGTEPSIVNPDLNVYAIADDKWGQIFVGKYGISARNPYTDDIVTIAIFPSPKYVEELAFDSDGNLYALEGDEGGGSYDFEILKLIPPQIIIWGCNTGIIDWPMQDESTIGNVINDDCSEILSHGDFVSCVVTQAEAFMRGGLLSPQQMAAIITCAAR